MGSSRRLAVVAAASAANARNHYNHTQPAVQHTEPTSYNINIFFVSVTLCGVLVAVCAACWRRSPTSDKPERRDTDVHGVYTVSGDARLLQEPVEIPGPPPAYETVVEDPPEHKDCQSLQEVVSEPCDSCQGVRPDSGLPSYEAAVLLRDTKL